MSRRRDAHGRRGCLLKMTEFSTELLQKKDLRAVQRTAPRRYRPQAQADVVEAFEDTGVAAPEKRARMKAVLQRLEEVRQAFARNVRDNKSGSLSPRGTKGLPARTWRRAARRKGNFCWIRVPEYELS